LRRLLTLIALIIMISSAFMQESEQASFDKGMQDYQNEDYENAQTSFFKVLQAFPNGKLKTAAKLMLGKTYYQKGDYSGVQIICKNFYNNHPNSSYVDDVHQLEGDALFQLGEYTTAVEEWLWVIHNSKDPRLKKKAGNYVFNTMDRYFSEKEIKSLELKYQDNIFNGLVSILRAKKLIENGEDSKGRSLLKKFLREEPSHFYADDAHRLLGETPSASISDNTFIYFKPGEGDLKEIGDQIENGMRYAIFEHETRNEGQEINLEPVELEESLTNAITVSEQKIKSSRPVCVVGPIDADQCAALSLLSKDAQRPYVVPLSSEVGFTQLSPYTFQLTPDVETKGRFLGEYAVQKLELKKFAILAPVNNYGRGFAQSFMEAVQANGGEIITDQWYYVGSEDFSRQFKAIRKESFIAEFKEQQDTTKADTSVRNNLTKFLEKKFENIDYGQDSTLVPATGIDGILILTTSRYISYMASQFAFHNINCTVLGNEGWNDPDQLQKFRQYVDGLVYVTSRFYDKNSWNYKEFMNRYRLQMHDTPELFQLLGYDMMKWLLQGYKSGMTPDELREALEKSQLYQGIVENIQFSDKPRVNDSLKVMKFSLGQLVRLN
jgi:ABC-type branched-subunit amino acid transport system substrate-binding protein